MNHSATVIHVGVAEYCVAADGEVLVSSALGSCVGVTFFDPVKRIGALAHIMLPSQMRLNGEQPSGKFVDLALPAMLREMQEQGALRTRTSAKIVGGAQMFADESLASIGDRNVAAVKEVLRSLGLRLLGEDTGGSHARTVEFHTSSGIVYSRSVRFGVKEL